ncbi:SMODS-associated NUDIX domain-containing protein [Streptomyces sp. NPDC054841]
MIEKIVVSVAAALLGYIGRTLWQNRRHLSLLRLLFTPRRRMRVSVAVLLRLHDEDHYVLFDSLTRPGAFGPPGGVVKYRDTARADLDKIGFEPESRIQPLMKRDLRGFLSALRVPHFARWLYREEGREPATDCLRRELGEELGEVGHPELSPLAKEVGFTLVRRLIDGPLKVAGESYRQIRFIEVYDLLPDRPEAVELRSALLALAADPAEGRVIGASRQDIALGRAGAHMILPQSAFLTGGERLREDIQPVR